ncbi:crotonase/enoyl-CoA hydratase family protein [soil metagenome]
MTEQILLTEKRGGVMVICMNRPVVRNAINADLSHAVSDALRELDASPDLAVGVLTGSGDSFSAGMDLRAYGAGESIEVEGRGVAGLTRTPPTKPLIAAVEGFALAGGFEMALACDLIIAGTSAQFGIPEVSRGLVAGSGGLLRLVRRMPYAVASELALTGRRMGSAEAARWGIVNEVVADGSALERALEVADSLRTNSPTALRATKEILLAGDEMETAAAWRLQDKVLDEVFASEDAAEGAAAFVEKRAPRWTGR